MAHANPLRPHSKIADSEDSDHIGSGASTPPGGASTPRPDLVDKRLPQLQNYFAQVRYFPHNLLVHSSIRFAPVPFVTTCTSTRPAPSSYPSISGSSSSPQTLADTSQHLMAAPAPPADSTTASASTSSAHGLLTAPNSPTSPALLSHEEPPPLSHERPDVGLKASTSQEQEQYPTPPLSTSSSMLKLDGTAAGRQEPGIRTQKSTSHRKSQTVSPPPRLRRNTLQAANTLNGIVTAPTVTAQFSNPANSADSPDAASVSAAALSSQSPPPDSSYSTRASSHSSDRSTQKRKRELTKGDAVQATPPHTPRALSAESKPEEAATTTSSNASTISATSKNSRSSSSTSDQPPVGQSKGQLHVSIIEGRGLRPSTAPYVVCIFQLNEDISEGAEGDAMDTRDDGPSHHREDDLARGVAMRRIGSDQGKPMQIPNFKMSRQSSQTDIARLKNSASNDQVTDPTWKHDAVL